MKGGDSCPVGEPSSCGVKSPVCEKAGKTCISELKAIAFAAAKSDKSDGSCFFKFLEDASSHERNIFQISRRYLNYMEEKKIIIEKPLKALNKFRFIKFA